MVFCVTWDFRNCSKESAIHCRSAQDEARNLPWVQRWRFDKQTAKNIWRRVYLQYLLFEESRLGKGVLFGQESSAVLLAFNNVCCVGALFRQRRKQWNVACTAATKVSRWTIWEENHQRKILDCRLFFVVLIYLGCVREKYCARHPRPTSIQGMTLPRLPVGGA